MRTCLECAGSQAGLDLRCSKRTCVEIPQILSCDDGCDDVAFYVSFNIMKVL